MKKILFNIFAGIGIFFIGLIVLIVVGASFAHRKDEVTFPDKIVLTLNLDDGLRESMPQQGLVSLLQGAGGMSLHQIIQTMDQARQDQRVQGLAVTIQDGTFGLASVQELRDAILRFRRAGKFAYVYADTLGDRPAMAEYWLASSFDQIWLQPLGGLTITGFDAEIPFGRGLADKIGITPELLHVGKYKSFPESVMLYSASAENRAMTLDMLQSLSQSFAHDLYAARHVNAKALDGFIAQSPIASDRALVAGLIDAVGYRDEFDSYLEQTTNGGQPVALENYATDGPRPTPGDKMALITAVGALTNTTADESAVSGDIVPAEEIVAAIQDAVDTKAIKAIIIRVDSPGGTPLAADMIRRAIELARVRKPVVVSMSNTAASGGYWMSVAANKIVAQPATLTGSIGVFGGKFNAANLLAKLGVNFQSLPENGQQDMWSVSKPYSATSRAKIQAQMQETYDIFVRRVAQGRHMSVAAVEKVAQGRVWTGVQAKQNGLVDALGGMDTAIALARDLATIKPDHAINLVLFPKPLSPMQQLVQMLSAGQAGGSMVFATLGTWLQQTLSVTVQRVMTHGLVFGVRV